LAQARILHSKRFRSHQHLGGMITARAGMLVDDELSCGMGAVEVAVFGRADLRVHVGVQAVKGEGGHASTPFCADAAVAGLFDRIVFLWSGRDGGIDIDLVG
jgi:hypothetical protein